jgi:hypothetical protein
MRRLTGTELGILVIASVFIVAGTVTVLHPTELDVFHQAYRRVRGSVEHVTKEGSRVYGTVAIIMGSGLVWMVFYGRRK